MGGVPALRPLSMLARRHGLVRSPLRRPTDRVKGVLAMVLAVLAVLVVPLALSMATGAYHRELAEAAVRTTERTMVTAVLTSDAAVQGSPAARWETPPRAVAPARWRLPDGRAGSGQLPVAVGQRAGAQLPIWVDHEGNRTQPPQTREAAVTTALVIGIDVVILGWLSLGVLWWTAGQVLDRINAAWWDVQWARIGPRWSRQSWP